MPSTLRGRIRCRIRPPLAALPAAAAAATPEVRGGASPGALTVLAIATTVLRGTPGQGYCDPVTVEALPSASGPQLPVWPKELQPGQVVEVAPGVARVIAPNPGIMTGPGTNTYLLGDQQLAL